MWQNESVGLLLTVRRLCRRPAFTITALATLTLGIGATTAIFTVVDGVLLRPLPYRDPGQLVTIFTTFPHWRGLPVVGPIWNTLRTPYPDYLELTKRQRAFDGVAGFQVSEASLRVGDQTVAIGEGAGTANLLQLLGVPMATGRWFLPGDDGPGARRLAVLSDELWRTRLGGAPGILGGTITIDEEPFTVVGILPRGFLLTARSVEGSGTRPVDLWIPFGVYPSMVAPNNHTLELIGRLKHGVSMSSALADAEPLLRGGRQPAKRGARLVPRAEVETGDVKRPLELLFAAVGVLLLITCGNVAALFLGECVLREPELKTRAVLGAERPQLVRLLLMESGLLAAGGGAAGIALSWWGTRILLALAPRELPHAQMVHIDLRVAAFAIALVAVVGIACGIVPALRVTKAQLTGNVAANRVTAGRSSMQYVVIGLQAAMTVVLMAGAGLLTRSLINQGDVKPGFRADRLLALRVDLPSSMDRDGTDDDRLNRIIADAVSALPNVATVTAVSTPPLSGRTNGQAVSPRPDEKLTQASSDAQRSVILPNYFDVLRVPVLAGRAFTDQDGRGAPLVAVVSEAFARRFWPDQPAVGKQFRCPNGVETVVGVVGDVRNEALDQAPEAMFYLPAAQTRPHLTFIVNTLGDPGLAAPVVLRTIWRAVPGATVSEVTPMSALVARALAPARYRALLSLIFALLAGLLTVVGVAGITSRAVASRLRELCIRIAIGATLARTLALATRDVLSAVTIGIAAGLVMAVFTSHWLAEYLYQAVASDTVTYVATITISVTACVAAALLAARRLIGIDLVRVLRDG